MSIDPAALLDRIDRTDPQAALELVQAEITAGATVTDLVTGLLAPAQALAGQRWLTSEWSVAQEHRASGVIEDALGLLATHARAATDRGRVTMVCATGEWHTTPARMAALALRDQGWAVDFLGGSAPPEHVAETVASTTPVALAISATLPPSLAGIPALVAAAHDLDTPVLLGGRALDAEGRRARVLGADGHAADLRTAAAILDGWRHDPPALRTASIEDATAAERARLADSIPELVDRAHRQLADGVPAMAVFTAQQHRDTRRGLAWVLQYVDVALLVDDPGLIADHVGWLRVFMTHRQMPPAMAQQALAALRAAVGGDLPRTRDLLRHALDELAG